MLTAFILVFGAYLVGSTASAILISRAMGLPDPRSEGSGNPGATNVLRLGGKKAAALTLLGDVLKGLIPVLIAHQLDAGPGVIVLVALAAFFGHLYPVFFRFEGGKGVATAFGALLGIDWLLGTAVLVTWLSVALVSRYSSLAALITAVAAPALAWWLTKESVVALGLVVMSAFLIARHRGNIERLLAGEEDKIGSKKIDSRAT